MRREAWPRRKVWTPRLVVIQRVETSMQERRVPILKMLSGPANALALRVSSSYSVGSPSASVDGGGRFRSETE
jgi:hypothetical protein